METETAMSVGKAPNNSITVRVFEAVDQVASAAADLVLSVSCAHQASRRFNLALSGGSTPRRMYEKLANMPEAARVLGKRAEFFFSDERAVGPEDEESNYRMARQYLFEPLSIMPVIIHRMHGEKTDLSAEAARYSKLIKSKCPGDGKIPRIDMTILGLGGDGHTASLFPDYDFEISKNDLIVAPFVESQQSNRLSFSVRLINASRQVLFLVTGEGKADPLKQILEPGGELLPAGRVQAESVIWLIDEEAASKLDRDKVQLSKA